MASVISLVAGFVGFPVSERILEKVWGKEAKSAAILKHYEELKGNIYSKWRDSKVVWITHNPSDTAFLLPFLPHMPAPLFLGVDKYQVGGPHLQMAISHLKDHRYEGYLDAYSTAWKFIEEHNQKARNLVSEVRKRYH